MSIRRKWLVALLLIVPLVVMSVLSWNKSLTGDEGLTVFATGSDVHTLIENVSQDNHPPLYYFMMLGWRSIFGDSTESLRLFALLPGIAIILLAVFLISPYAALLFAFSPFLLHISVELRMYGFLALAGLLQLLAFRKDDEDRTVFSMVLLVLTLSLGTWLHHFGWLGVAAACTLLTMRRKWGRAVITGVFVVILYLPWLSTALEQWRSFGGEAVETSSVYLGSTGTIQRLTGIPFSLGGTLVRFSAGTAGVDFGLFTPDSVDMKLILALALAGVMVTMVAKGVSKGTRPELVLLLWVFLPLSFLRPSSRHFALAFPAFIILASAGLEGLRGNYRKYLSALIPAMMLLFGVLFTLKPVMPQRCTYYRDLREAAIAAGDLAADNECPVHLYLDHYTSMAMLFHLEQEGFDSLELDTPFDDRFSRGRFFISDPGEILSYLQHDTDSLVASWFTESPEFVLVANDPGKAGGRIFGSENRFIGMGSDVMSDLDLMDALRARGDVQLQELRNSQGPFTVMLVRGRDITGQ